MNKITRLIRLDDYPHGDKGMWDGKSHQNQIKPILDLFEQYKINYILGVTPFLLKFNDYQFLNATVGNGLIVMHGFDHGWSLDWLGNIQQSWPDGGEFMSLDEKTLEQQYEIANIAMFGLTRYDRSKFIPPFNCFTQELLNVLSKYGITDLYGLDEQYNDYNQARFDYHGINIHLSEYHKTYGMINTVLKHLDNNSVLTLHWIYDSLECNYLENYEKLCKLLTN